METEEEKELKDQPRRPRIQIIAGHSSAKFSAVVHVNKGPLSSAFQ